MILDSQLMMSDKQVLVANTTSINTIEIPRIAPGHHLDMSLVVNVHSQSGTNPTLKATLETSADGTTFTSVQTLVKPAEKNRFGLSLDNLRLSRYLRMSYTLGGVSPGFTVSAMLAAGVDDWKPVAVSARQA
ncbi:MAG TPA: hypothetical protein PKH27_04810 [Candidatus Desulfobacillus denitrificans]|nr:hypothetical protein [Candidatus Desulfobacillus denitrificans]HNT62369.1 hypothetical protein [Candidatus Desulfobacillus denitrificans]